MSKEQVIYDNVFDLHKLNKFASLMTLGNGYLGLRASHEEGYTEQVRGMYVAGIYNKATLNEMSEIVNLPDIIGMKIEIDGESFSLLDGIILSYHRKLNLASGELIREITWKNKHGFRFQFIFQRFVSKDNLHLLASKLTVVSLDYTAQIKIVTGIDAQQTNSGRQHLIEEQVRVFDDEWMQGIYQTTESGHTIAIGSRCRCKNKSKQTFSAKNRQLDTVITTELLVNTPFVVEKMGVIYTSLDRDLSGNSLEDVCLTELKSYSAKSYDELLGQSTKIWEKFWQERRIIITSENAFDQLAVDFALYHLEIMTPSHDERFSVGAKGLTGEGYKGHVFWDTEIFINPFHVFSEPNTAKNLLKYRYSHLHHAQEKAKKNGYEGALFPWESAFTGKEETPEFAGINIKTGKRQKVASAIAEHHIVADIAYAVVQYYQNTFDDEFMKKQGLSLLKETARFWMSRTTEENGKLSIKDVIGPDEYTEHVDNNAYTNYMAAYNVEQALRFMEVYQDSDDDFVKSGRHFLDRIYLPVPNENGLIPQDDTFLQKPEIDLTGYKESQGSQTILLHYSRQEVIDMQILKQADVVMLMYLLPHLFSKEIALKNLKYYEEHTIHDSSLSKAIHSIVAARCDEMAMAYRFFQEACLIDLGPNPHSSDEGIHAASLGAIWLAVVFGFVNIANNENRLSVQPHLPQEWSKIVLPLHFQGSQIHMTITHQTMTFTKISGPDIVLEINGEEILLTDKIEINGYVEEK
jgi:hypothetical glycosyl hydrolase